MFCLSVCLLERRPPHVPRAMLPVEACGQRMVPRLARVQTWPVRRPPEKLGGAERPRACWSGAPERARRDPATVPRPWRSPGRRHSLDRSGRHGCAQSLRLRRPAALRTSAGLASLPLQPTTERGASLARPSRRHVGKPQVLLLLLALMACWRRATPVWPTTPSRDRARLACRTWPPRDVTQLRQAWHSRELAQPDLKRLGLGLGVS